MLLWKERIFVTFLLSTMIVSLLVVFPSISLAVEEGRWPVVIVDTIVYVAAVTLLLLRKRISFRIRAVLTSSMLLAVALGVLISIGPFSGGLIWLFSFSMYVGMFMGLRAGFCAVGINALCLILMGWLVGEGRLEWAHLWPNALHKWVIMSINFMFLNTLMTIFVSAMMEGLRTIGQKERAVSAALEKDRAELLQAKENLETEIEVRKQADQARRLSEERYRDLFDSITDLIYTHDLKGRLITVNQSLADLSGYKREDIIGSKISDFMKPEMSESFHKGYLDQVITEGQSEGISVYFTKEGNKRYFEYRSALVQPERGEPYISGSGREVTEQILARKKLKHLQDQLLQSQKLEAVGTLAGGVAHDFNNLLQGIQGCADLLLLKKNPDEPGFKEIKEIDRAVRSAGELTRQLLTFSRRLQSDLRPLSLNQQVQLARKLLERTIPKMIRLVVDLDPHAKNINADPSQIEQMLMNLAINARDAMPDGGTIRIETENVLLDEEFCKHHLGVTPGAFALLSVSDTGCGMHGETLKHIFEPFFTTKEVERGTGLGLAMVYGIVKSHGGLITCQSTPGSGSTFNVYFPSLVQDAPLTDSEEKKSQPQGGTETILLVDDEEVIQDFGRKALVEFGYKVLTASDGESALKLYRKQQSDIDLVIMDLIMPGMGGYQCLQRILELNPDVPILVASGNSKTREKSQWTHATGFISKPYRLNDMLCAIRKSLDQEH